MKIEFPSKEKLAEMFADEELPNIHESCQTLDLIDMCVQAMQIVVEEYPLEEYKPLEEYIGYGSDIPYYQLDPELIKQLNIPSAMLTSDETGFPLLFLRIFTKEGDLLTEARSNLFYSAGFFARKALAVIDGYRKAGGVITDEEFREFIIRKTANMLKSALSKLSERIEITMNSFLEEVAYDWTKLWYEYAAETNSLQGFKPPRIPFAKERERLLKKHEDDIRAMWPDDSGNTLSNLKKMRLVYEYKRTYEHWKDIERLQMEKKNWHRYVRAGDMEDITDDLIEDFERDIDISLLALEHAARRVELYNIYDVSETSLRKRAQGVKVSGYSRANLFKLKREGEKLITEELEKRQSKGE